MKTKAKTQQVKVGLREIAAVAQVGVATVSRVLNGNNRVDPTIQALVMEAATKLDVDVSQRNKAKALALSSATGSRGCSEYRQPADLFGPVAHPGTERAGVRNTYVQCASSEHLYRQLVARDLDARAGAEWA